VRDVSHLEPSALLTLITWDGVGTESNRRELDVELGRWGYLDNTNVHYVVQPYYVPANFVAFRTPPGTYTHSFRWEPGQVRFSTVAGSSIQMPVVSLTSTCLPPVCLHRGENRYASLCMYFIKAKYP